MLFYSVYSEVESEILAVFDQLAGCEDQVKSNALAPVAGLFSQVCGTFGQLDKGRLICPSTCNISACEGEICGWVAIIKFVGLWEVSGRERVRESKIFF